MIIESCANCGETIGALQAAHVWQGMVVCGGCRVKLEAGQGGTGEKTPAKPERTEAASLPYAIPSTDRPPVAATGGMVPSLAAAREAERRWKRDVKVAALIFVAGIGSAVMGFFTAFVLNWLALVWLFVGLGLCMLGFLAFVWALLAAAWREEFRGYLRRPGAGQ